MSAPRRIAGENKAKFSVMILSGVMVPDWLGENTGARQSPPRSRECKLLAEFGGSATTGRIGKAILG